MPRPALAAALGVTARHLLPPGRFCRPADSATLDDQREQRSAPSVLLDFDRAAADQSGKRSTHSSNAQRRRIGNGRLRESARHLAVEHHRDHHQHGALRVQRHRLGHRPPDHVHLFHLRQGEISPKRRDPTRDHACLVVAPTRAAPTPERQAHPSPATIPRRGARGGPRGRAVARPRRAPRGPGGPHMLGSRAWRAAGSRRGAAWESCGPTTAADAVDLRA